eukprot:m.59290 g.59290  ORF g.59290 m.59290 type:complete len:672 (+) comp13815_c0_seq2:115-2130(+)
MASHDKNVAQATVNIKPHALAKMKSTDSLELYDKLATLLQPFNDITQLAIPRIVVVGDQSSGKSSFLQAVCGFKLFPTGTERCTLCPAVLQLRSAPEGSQGSGFFSFKGFNDPELGDVSTKFEFDPASPPTKEIQLKMRQLQGYIEKTHGSIIKTELTIGLTAPGLRNLTLVDLPGVIQISTDKNGTDAETSTRLTKDFIDPSKKNLVVLVLNGNIPIENSAAARILTERLRGSALERSSRSIAIMTKLDNPEGRFDEEKARYACRAINNEHRVPGIPDVYGVTVKNCKTSSVAKAEKATFDDVEQYQAVRDRCGMGSVLDRLLAMQEDNLRSELPRVLRELQTAQKPVESKLAALPLPPQTQDELSRRVAKIKRALEASFKNATTATKSLRRDLQQGLQNSMQSKVNVDYLIDLIRPHKDKSSVPGNIPPSAIKEGAQDLSAGLYEQIVTKANQVLAASIQLAQEAVAKLPDVEVAGNLGTVLNQYIQETFTDYFQKNKKIVEKDLQAMLTAVDWNSSEFLKQMHEQRHEPTHHGHHHRSGVPAFGASLAFGPPRLATTQQSDQPWEHAVDSNGHRSTSVLNNEVTKLRLYLRAHHAVVVNRLLEAVSDKWLAPFSRFVGPKSLEGLELKPDDFMLAEDKQKVRDELVKCLEALKEADRLIEAFRQCQRQ